MLDHNNPSHQRRIVVVQTLYTSFFKDTKEPPISEYAKPLVEGIREHEKEINKHIDTYALKFASDKMARIDLAILQLGVYELLFERRTPFKVVIDECVELAKEFGDIHSPQFINGILGKIVENNRDLMIEGY